MIQKTFLYVLILGSIISCVPKKNMLYFQESEKAESNSVIKTIEPQFQVGDLLNINVAALDAETVVAFNLYETINTTNPKPMSYLVDANGFVNFPVLGKIKVSGCTNQQLTAQLTKDLTTYITNPIVNIRLLNFKVTVLGEVKNPGAFTILNERLTLLEALGLAGDLTIQANRKTIKLIREKDGKRIDATIDLTHQKVFDSPYYYLMPNDVIYVAPNKSKINSSVVGANSSIIISAISTLISLIAILTR